MITEWEDLEGRTIERVVSEISGEFILLFADGEIAVIRGVGEEIHGCHWPVLSDDEEDLAYARTVLGEEVQSESTRDLL